MKGTDTVKLRAERIVFSEDLSSEQGIRKMLAVRLKKSISVFELQLAAVVSLCMFWLIYIRRNAPAGTAVTACIPAVAAALFFGSLLVTCIYSEGHIIDAVTDRILTEEPPENRSCISSFIMAATGKNDTVLIPAKHKRRYLDAEHALAVAEYGVLYFDETAYGELRSLRGKDIRISYDKKEFEHQEG